MFGLMRDIKMSLQNQQMMNDLYLAPDIFWELSEEKQEAALVEMQETYDKLLQASEQGFENLREIITALAGYAKMINMILNS
jgi:hypothetical protein